MSKTTRRKQLIENNWSKKQGGKLVEKQLAENAPAENSSQEQKIFSDKYSANFAKSSYCVIKFLLNIKYYTVNYKSEILQAII